MRTSLHRLDLASPGTFAGARVVCLGGPDDLCRQWCAEGCEEECYRFPLPADVELVAQAPVEGHRWAPLDPPYCREAEWLNSTDPLQESAEDPDAFPFDEDGVAQLGVRSGFIDLVWDGGDYVWSYCDEQATDTVARVPGPADVTLFEVPA
jgi:hypothetical protein